MLIARMHHKVIRWCGQVDDRRLGGTAYDAIEKHRTFEPPMAKKLGIVRCNNDRRPVHAVVEPLDLSFTVENEIAGVLISLCCGPIRIVNFLINGLTRDALVFNSSVCSNAVL